MTRRNKFNIYAKIAAAEMQRGDGINKRPENDLQYLPSTFTA